MGRTLNQPYIPSPSLPKWFFGLAHLIFIITPCTSFAQCTSGCTTSYTTCANIASIAAAAGTVGSNNVVCIFPPAG